MDPRYYIFGGLILFAATMFAVAILASLRHRRAASNARRVAERIQVLATYAVAAPDAQLSTGLPAEPGHHSEPELEPELELELELEPIFTPAPAYEPEAVPESQEAPASLGSPLREDVVGYALVAPVELHFTEGKGRVGVRPGTRTYAEFQRMAGVILGDLERLRRS
ncbi:MAG: hypothetical protein Q7J82_04205 [Coriobacteriia bacterium]|nr:hypothetical protein [Coriobacteriia bacterium]